MPFVEVGRRLRGIAARLRWRCEKIRTAAARRRLQVTFDSLPERSRACFGLHRFDGFSVRQIAVRECLTETEVEEALVDALVRLGAVLTMGLSATNDILELTDYFQEAPAGELEEQRSRPTRRDRT